MLWSLQMQSLKKYTQRVEEPYHITMASLDITRSDDQLIQVMVVFGGNAMRYLLCSLSKKNVWQVPLNLHMERGTFITLSCNGRGSVHLTGYYKNPKLSDSAVMSAVISAHIHEDINTLDEVKDYLKQNREKIEYQKIIHGSWLVQKINTEKENQENERKTKSKRKANSPEDQAAKRVKPSANSNENRSNNDNYDQNIESLGRLIEDNNYFESKKSSDCDKNTSDLDCDKDEDKSDNDDCSFSSSSSSDTAMSTTMSSSSDSNDDEIKMQSEEDKSQGEEKNEKQQGKKVNREEAIEKQKDKKKKGKQQENNKWIMSNGVKVERVKPGTGKVAEMGKFVTIYYFSCVLVGTETTKVRHCLEGRGFRFKLGTGDMPRRVHEGIVGMKVGEKRRIVMPPKMMGKKSKGARRSKLVYDVELIKVE